MKLAAALDLEGHELVSFVGAGGKKTAMARLVEEGTARNRPVAYTTTTHVPPPDLPIVVSEAETLEHGLEEQDPPVAFARDWVDQPERADRKLRGFEPAVVDWFHRTRRFDWLLVKADGARRRAFKAPGPDEPVVPEETTHLVVVASVGVVGERLDETHVHRPGRVAAITGLAPDDVIQPEHVGAVLGSQDGGLNDAPERAVVTYLVNQADTDALAATAHEVAQHALAATDGPARAVVSSFRTGRCEVVEQD